jgi:hypothetical protein
MAKSINIFGLIREEITVCGIPLLKRQSLTPAERVWLQENSEAARNEWNVSYLAFVDAVKDKFKYKSQEDAYHAVKEYFRGTLDTVDSDRIELLSLEKPLKSDKNIEEAELTFMMNSRIVAKKFPTVDFEETFGLIYTGEWTEEFTKATAEIHPGLVEFFAKESAGEKDELLTEKTGK